MRSFLIVRDFFASNRWSYIGGILCLLAVDGLQMVIPQIFRIVTDKLEAGTLDAGALTGHIAILLGIAICVAVGRFGWRMLINGTSRRLEYDLRSRLFAHLQKLSPNYFNHHKTGDLMAHLTNDLQAVRQATGPGVVMLADITFLLSFTIVTMFVTVDWRLVVVGLLPMPFLAIAVLKLGGPIHRRFRVVQDAFAQMTDVVQENLNGMRVVKSFTQESAEIEKFRKKNEYNRQKEMHLVRIWGLMEPTIKFVGGLGFLAVLWYGSILVIQGAITLGEFVAFNSYLAMMVWPMMAIGFATNQLQRGSASMERLAGILRERPDIVDGLLSLPTPAARGRIEVRDLTFTYPGSDAPALEHVSLSVGAGESLGIMGRTGSGKSTLIQLLLRLYDPPRGTIFLDGVDVLDLSLAELRIQMGIVPQEGFLFSMDLATNIAFGNEDASREEVERAVEIAQLAGEIERFPDGYDTMVGERGVTLSGGQQQRTAIARAITKDPRILILDDALSAVDARTEAAILQGLGQVLADRTSIIISHRVSAVQNLDQIIVLEEGTVQERGTHDELVALGGLYARTDRQQRLEQELEEGLG